MNNFRILIVDDDDNICQLLSLYLKKEGYDIFVCNNGKDAINLVKNDSTFSVVLLDIMMPVMDGIETLARIREFSSLPVILVSAKGEPMDKITGLDLGADDYVTKPFEPQELISRIKAILRRVKVDEPMPNSDLTIANFFISLHDYIVKVNGVKIEMPPKEIELLYYLASNPMQVFKREQLLESVWEPDYKGDSRTVDVHIKRIRDKLKLYNSKCNVDTVWGVGYKFEVLDV